MKADRFYTVATLADRLAVSGLTVRRLIARGKLPAYRVGRAVRVSPAAVESFLSSVLVGPAGLPEVEEPTALKGKKR